ncbi:sigma-70 family RNA polymerase sigma factor [Crocinitomicaceae bacterium]|jgi:RNA polymerase sigma factor (sigma-70 family)|nr:sigma-70 family RNA polymerase sigma factor [Flavobacteriales bacterium]MDC0460071.1 sigma-70 family RNA polymerase sigma factor [Crocinitomicaceae bacterium]MDC1266603.1 sigma-70 family RNA polymerase sigma factor [Crocinitomicaceae bacterium]
MNYRLHHSLFNEIMNRYDLMFVSVIRSHFNNQEDQKDIYQEFSIHLFMLIEAQYSKSIDLLHTATWLKAVVSNFCKSQIRKKNAKRKIKFSSDGFITTHLEQFSEDSNTDTPLFDFSGDINSYEIMKSVLKLVSRQEAMMLKMKYYYNKPSTYISRKLNVTHVDVKIGRLKKRIQRLTGINNIEELLEKYEV